MKKFVLKPFFSAHLVHSGLLACTLAPFAVTTRLQANTLSVGEVALFKTQLAELARYQKELIDAHNDFFNPASRKEQLPSELARLSELEQRIKSIAQKCPKGGTSPFARQLFSQYSAVVQRLSQAQTRWVAALSKKSLEALFDIQASMKTDIRRIEAIMLGTGTGQIGLIGTLEKSHPDLARIATPLYADIVFIFHYDEQNTHYRGRLKKISLANHLTRHKGFKGLSSRLMAKYVGLK